jgi:hypothetical protein
MLPLPDILAIQEIEPIDQVPVFAGDCQPTYRDRSCVSEFPKRGCGMFSYTQTKLTALDPDEPFSGFRRYEADHGGLRFNVAGVWPWATKSAKTSYRQAHDGLTLHDGWIRDTPTVILGDFNANASFKGRNWSQLLELTHGLGLVSAYHSHFQGEPFGKEKRPTHFHRGKESAPFHLDYIFLPQDWARRITNVTVGTYSDWHKVSDHVPLVVDLVL